MIKSISEKDPVAGARTVPTYEEEVAWYNISSLAIGECIEIN